MRLIILLLVLSVYVLSMEDSSLRSKRSYYGGFDSYGYGDNDFWYAGRIFGIIVGILLFLLCCCAPCVCLLGIWFLGWFGVRERRRRRNETKIASLPTVSAEVPVTTTYSTPPRARNVVIETAPRQYDNRHDVIRDDPSTRIPAQITEVEKNDKIQRHFLGANQIRRIENVGQLKVLDVLSVPANSIANIEGFTKIVNLKEIYLSQNGLQKIEAFEMNENLEIANAIRLCPQITRLDSEQATLRILSDHPLFKSEDKPRPVLL